jgi:hypothetical protein
MHVFDRLSLEWTVSESVVNPPARQSDHRTAVELTIPSAPTYTEWVNITLAWRGCYRMHNQADAQEPPFCRYREATNIVRRTI